MLLEQIHRAITADGFVWRQCCDTHWQVRRGKVIVNIHHGRRGFSMYVPGAESSVPLHSAAQVLEAARAQPCREDYTAVLHAITRMRSSCRSHEDLQDLRSLLPLLLHAEREEVAAARVAILEMFSNERGRIRRLNMGEENVAHNPRS